MAGYGSVSGAPASGIQVEESLPVQTDDIHAIRLRYVIPTVNVPTGFSLGANVAQRYDLRQQTINALLVTVTTGVVFGYFGDNTALSGKPGTFPHFVVSAAVVAGSQTIPLPPDDGYIITLQEGAGATVSGCLTPQAL